MQEYLENTDGELSLHSPYSPDLTSCNFWQLSTLKKHLRDRWFISDKKVINEVHTFFKSLLQAEFEKTVKVKWGERMELCIVNVGRYFEKVLIKKTDCESEDSVE